jgi:hypothetical protein
VRAETLRVGERVVRADGGTAVVVGLAVVPGAAAMWDLTVSQVHTFIVGSGHYVVYNCPAPTSGGGKPQTWNVGGGEVTPEFGLTKAEEWLGSGYKEMSPGVFRSADGSRQFRMRDADLQATQPHIHFEIIAPNGRWILENSHVYLI